MPQDPILRLAQKRIIKASIDLEVQLSTMQGSAPAIEMLRRARDEAADSLTKMVFLNLDDPGDLIKMRVMQNEVKRYDELVGWMSTIIAEGKMLDVEMQESERDEMLDILTETAEGQQEAIDSGLVDDQSKQHFDA
jgi:hypothetical protein